MDDVAVVVFQLEDCAIPVLPFDSGRPLPGEKA